VKSQQSLKLRIMDYVFLNAASKKRKKSCFLYNVKNVFSNCAPNNEEFAFYDILNPQQTVETCFSLKQILHILVECLT